MTKGNYSNLPNGWICKPLKHSVSINSEVLSEATSPDALLKYVDIASLDAGLCELTPNEIKFSDAPSRARRVLRSGDTIVSTVRTYLKAISNFPIVEGTLIASTGFAVLRPNGTLTSRFAYWAVFAKPFIESVVSSSSGVSYPAINPGVLGDLPVAVPLRCEQERIANFLDEKTARIDALIAEKERLTSLVSEYEQAEISRLLTRGVLEIALNKTGQKFIPEAPPSWRVAVFKRALLAMSQGWSPQCESQPAEPGEWGVLKVGCVNRTKFNAFENKALPSNLEPDYSCVLRKGDVLMSRANTKELVGMSALVEDEYPNLMLCDKLYRLELCPYWVLPGYAVLMLRSDTSRRQIELGASGASSSMQNISQDVVRELIVAFPPIAEQKLILEKTQIVRDACWALAEHATAHIARLREYRSSLITAAVTGQLDVGTHEDMT